MACHRPWHATSLAVCGTWLAQLPVGPRAFCKHSLPPLATLRHAATPQGYRFYLIVFYILVAVLFASAAICVWVGWCFKNDSFPFLWPIKVARIVVSLFVSMFYIASLNIFLICIQCVPEIGEDGRRHWMHLIYHTGDFGGGCIASLRRMRAAAASARSTVAGQPAAHGSSSTLASSMTLTRYPDELVRLLAPTTPLADCLAMPHLVHGVFSILCCVLFFVVALLLVIADHELEPMSHSLLAAPQSMCEIRMLLLKTVITFADIMLRPLPHYQVVVYSVTCALMLYYQLRWVRGVGCVDKWLGGHNDRTHGEHVRGGQPGRAGQNARQLPTALRMPSKGALQCTLLRCPATDTLPP